jgi:hypothetical protein
MNCWQTDARDDGSFVPCPPYSPTLRRGHTNKPFAARRPSAGFEMRPVRTAAHKVKALVRTDIDNGTIAETLCAENPLSNSCPTSFRRRGNRLVPIVRNSP